MLRRARFPVTGIMIMGLVLIWVVAWYMPGCDKKEYRPGICGQFVNCTLPADPEAYKEICLDGITHRTYGRHILTPKITPEGGYEYCDDSITNPIED